MRPQLRGRRGRWGGRGPIMYRDLLPPTDETTAQGQEGEVGGGVL